MLTRELLKEHGIKYKQLKWRWMPENYELETSEFNTDGSFSKMEYANYMMNMSYKMNKFKHGQRYAAIRTRRRNQWYCTLVELELGEEVTDGT